MKRMTKDEERARDEFNRLVLLKSNLCVMNSAAGTADGDWVLDKCDGPMDAHHVIPKKSLKMVYPAQGTPAWFELMEPIMDGEKLKAYRMSLIWDARNGLPVCRRHHDLLTCSMRHLSPSQLYPSVLSFAIEHRLEHLLIRAVPGVLEGTK